MGLSSPLRGHQIHGEEVVSIRGDKNDVFSHGYICPKATALKEIFDDPDRLKQPVRWLETVTDISGNVVFNGVPVTVE